MVVFIVQNLNEIIDNAPSMLYKKEFAITPYGGAFLKNPEPAKAYVKEKIDKLLKTYRAAIYCSTPGETYQMDWGFTNVMTHYGKLLHIACFAMICHH